MMHRVSMSTHTRAATKHGSTQGRVLTHSITSPCIHTRSSHVFIVTSKKCSAGALAAAPRGARHDRAQRALCASAQRSEERHGEPWQPAAAARQRLDGAVQAGVQLLHTCNAVCLYLLKCLHVLQAARRIVPCSDTCVSSSQMNASKLSATVAGACATLL